jgi:hypothetical protein
LKKIHIIYLTLKIKSLRETTKWIKIKMKNNKIAVLSKLDKKITNLATDIEKIEDKLSTEYSDKLQKDLEILEKRYSRLITIEERKKR